MIPSKAKNLPLCSLALLALCAAAHAQVFPSRPGASGHIGAEFVAKSAPDGHTLVMASTAALDEKNVVQFAPVSLVSASAYVVAVNPDVGVGSVRDLIALAKAKPGKLTFGSASLCAKTLYMYVI